MTSADGSNNHVGWRKSSYSGNGPDCVELAVTWRKSSHSGGGSGDCVEVAVITGQEQIKR